jgi:2-polyprenyl-6-methoxyphenol hydroxylase-like FAD-dependent oxidoreductase
VVHCGAGYANGVAPLPDGTYFWDCVNDANRASVEACDLAAWRAMYHRRMPHAGEFVDAIESWKQLTFVQVRPFWPRERLVPGAALAGDAAGSVHPHSAQGANLALEDAVVLGDALAGPVPRGDLHAALSLYARRRDRKLRRYVLWSLLAAGSLDGRNRPWRALRRRSFGWSRVGPVRRENLRRQAGLA